MRSFARMHEKRGRPGRGERGGDFLPDVAAFPDAGDDDATLDGHETAHRLIERTGQFAVQLTCELNQSFRFEIERSDRRGDAGFDA